MFVTDVYHSHVAFAIRVMSVSTTRGRFHALRGRVYIDEQNPANSWVDVQYRGQSSMKAVGRNA